MPDELTWPVTLCHEPQAVLGPLRELADAARGASRSVPHDALELARTWAPRIPLPGRGRTHELWESLATVAAVDLSVARTLEPHLDARAILAEAGEERAACDTTWGVFAAESPESRLTATRSPSGWTLDGTKPWCSLAGDLTHALVTAWVDDERRGLYAVDLRHDGVHVLPASWHARGLRDIPSGPVRLDAVPARPLGDPGWYLRRDGFAWGGIGVAAVWYGGAVGLARRLWLQTRRRAPDQLALTHLGTVDSVLTSARTVLAEAADQVDAGLATGEAGALLAARARQVVADAVERVLSVSGHALGPGPLALEAEHAARVADLSLYLRQHHAERDAAALGERLASTGRTEGPPW